MPNSTIHDDQPKMTPKFDVDYVLANISEDDKIALLSGSDFWHTHSIPQFNVPSIRTTDGPNGIRGTKFFVGVPAACLPCGTALGATWDCDLLHQAGVLLGKECLAKGAHCWLGPTINMQRSPLGGRGFESFAEDPHLSGIMTKSIILGCESTGVISTVKHYVGNDQEHERRAVDVLVTPRALREIYLRPFQVVARDAQPGALMTSYNKINGKHVVESPAMLDIVRKDWNWDPLIMSDWLGTYTTIDSMNAGLDLEMPGPTRYRGSRAPVSAEETGRDLPEDRALNRTLCTNSIVLLKNEDNLLPFPKTIKKIALIGSHVKTPAISGGGSASLEPYYAVSLYDAVVEALPDAEILYEAGAYAHKMLPVVDRMLSNAVIHFYNEPPEKKERTLLATEPVGNTAFQLMDYSAPGLNRGLFWGTLIGEFTPDVSGLWDFGLTVFGTATLFIDDEMVIDNTTRQTRGTAFFGKGTVQEVGSKQLIAGQTYRIRIEFGSANTSPMKAIGVVHFGGGAAHLGACLHMDPEQMVANAVKVAAEADYTIVCTGLNRDWESEGFDRPDMDLPPGIDALISSVLDVAVDRTVIVNQSGTPVTMPWADRARAIVQAWYGGNETGHGIADVLFGDVNPCGKLPLSWPVDVRHNPAYLNYMSVGGRVLYGEDVYMGYRFYEKVGREVLFPFGYGLSYTTFSVSPEATVSPTVFSSDSPPTARVIVKNTGPVAGAQILQLYIAAPHSATPRPVKELHGFTKVFLQPGEQITVGIPIDKYATSLWDEIEDMWKSEEGVYQVLIGTSSQEIVSRGEFRIIAAAVGVGTVTIKTDWAWRIPSLLQIAPAMVQIAFILLLPESPRYLISKDRHEEAFDILTKYHAEGDRSSVIVRAEIAQIQRTIKLELEGSKQTWWDMFRTAGMRRRLLISAFLGLFTQWSGNTLISYYLSDLLEMVDITDGVVKSKINIGIACWGLLCGTTLALTVARFKRRTMYLTCACSLLCVYVAWTISMERFMSTHTKDAAILTIFFIFCYSPAYNLGYNALTYTYLVEIFPYFGRSRGISWFQFYGRGASFFATYVNPVGLKNISWKWLLVGFRVVFEGKEKANEVAAAVHKQLGQGHEDKAQNVHVEETLRA
ncbi:hypothetical protein Aspvir_010143 [Aspergillus viridinutans]|uniref:Probable beta-glucosidase H n=1 Tax=Aspergillus viridinutans TaxID=75553 RepID=A0A9P3F967_ASPVI|nr:uncharacterized protein Aspvir_010143 [Aspergillus viridinutans]GIK06025.1 hypothetical protein Aspvir_010143 [Aspergillus viridinutans]